MEIVVLILVFLITLAFLLKLSFWDLKGIGIVCLIVSAFVYLSYDLASEQSKNQIGTWLSNNALMLDTSVVLTIEVALMLAFGFIKVHINNVTSPKKSMRIAWYVLQYFPGFLIFPILFFGLTQLIYSLPGVSFEAIAISSAIGVAVFTLLGPYLIMLLLPEEELRLELLFLTSTFVAIFGIIATVNGRTVADVASEVDIKALLGTIVLFFVIAFIGFLWSKLKPRKFFT